MSLLFVELCCSREKFPASWQQPRRGELFKTTNKLPFGFQMFVAALPSDHPTEFNQLQGGRRSLWATDNGFFYAFRQVSAQVSSRKFVTPTQTIQVERLAGDLDESLQDFHFTKKRDVTFGYLGDDADEFGLFLDGYWLDTRPRSCCLCNVI